MNNVGTGRGTTVEPRVRLEQGRQALLEWLRTQSAEDRVDEATRELAERSLAR